MKKNSKERFVRNVMANVAILMVFGIVAMATMSMQIANVFGGNDGTQAIYKGDISKNNVALMVNVYWGTEYLPSMLKTLKDKNVKLTFFVGGTWVSENNDLLKQMYDEGHEIGNHGYFHKDHAKLSETRNNDEIAVTDRLVESIIGFKMTLFAPPSGSFNKTTLKAAKSLGYKTIMWSKDTIDWRDKDPQVIFSRATKNVSNGDLILMHPTASTAKMLPDIIDTIQKSGYNLDIVSNTI